MCSSCQHFHCCSCSILSSWASFFLHQHMGIHRLSVSQPKSVYHDSYLNHINVALFVLYYYYVMICSFVCCAEQMGHIWVMTVWMYSTVYSNTEHMTWTNWVEETNTSDGRLQIGRSEVHHDAAAPPTAPLVLADALGGAIQGRRRTTRTCTHDERQAFQSRRKKRTFLVRARLSGGVIVVQFFMIKVCCFGLLSQAQKTATTTTSLMLATLLPKPSNLPNRTACCHNVCPSPWYVASERHKEDGGSCKLQLFFG